MKFQSPKRPPDPTLAPPPDFRYVGLCPGSRRHAGAWAFALGAGAALGAGLWGGMDPPRLLAWAAGAMLAGAAVRRVRALRAAAREATPPSLAIVPWGVLVDSDERSRALHWAGIARVYTDVIYGRDLGTPTTRYSRVTIETAHERLVGRAEGAVSLERLFIHLGAYAKEASHRVALDLDGERSAEGPTEPSFEPLLSSARAYVGSASASGRLDLPALSYRESGAQAGSARAVEVLRRVLRDRTARTVDPRAFAAVLAAEIHAVELVDDLVDLVQSPHPVIAAVAKVAAGKLGVARARVGALEEVEPFLAKRDVEALASWQGAGFGEVRAGIARAAC
jgi:hypothetical protein